MEKNRLYHTNHDGTLTTCEEKAESPLAAWSTGPTWGEYDHDAFRTIRAGYVQVCADQSTMVGQGKILTESSTVGCAKGFLVTRTSGGVPGGLDGLRARTSPSTLDALASRSDRSAPLGNG